MTRLVIAGGKKLSGETKIQGAKNSALPIMSAALLTESQCVLHNCPELSDVDVSAQILRHLGSGAKWQNGSLIIDPAGIKDCQIPDRLMRKTRSSIIFLGSILARYGEAVMSFPGGCPLGPRPIDLHLSALRQMGAEIEESHGYVHCKAKNGLKGADISLSFPSVGATENIILAASTAKGKTVIQNAAREPEINDLADFLNSCGAKITGAGQSTVIIDGVAKLSGAEHMVIPDRIAAATYMAAAAATGGNLRLTGVEPSHLSAILPCFEEAGCRVITKGDALQIIAPSNLNRVRTIRTMPYPGFPTDAQAPFMAMCTLAQGTSIFTETIFDCRYKHVDELTRLGAKIRVECRMAVVEGVSQLSGAPVEATDLRGGGAMIVAGLAAQGSTQISNAQYIDRGYEHVEQVLESLGADIKRE